MKLFRNFRVRVENSFFYLEVWKFESFIWSHFLLPIKSPQHEMVKKYVAIRTSISKSCLYAKGPKPIRSLKMQLKCERTVSSRGARFLKMSYTCACFLLGLTDGESKLWEKLLCFMSIIMFLTTDRHLRLIWGALEAQCLVERLGYWVTQLAR